MIPRRSTAALPPHPFPFFWATGGFVPAFGFVGAGFAAAGFAAGGTGRAWGAGGAGGAGGPGRAGGRGAPAEAGGAGFGGAGFGAADDGFEGADMVRTSIMRAPSKPSSAKTPS